jgi:hypothetical protein
MRVHVCVCVRACGSRPYSCTLPRVASLDAAMGRRVVRWMNFPDEVSVHLGTDLVRFAVTLARSSPAGHATADIAGTSAAVGIFSGAVRARVAVDRCRPVAGPPAQQRSPQTVMRLRSPHCISSSPSITGMLSGSMNNSAPSGRSAPVVTISLHVAKARGRRFRASVGCWLLPKTRTSDSRQLLRRKVLRGVASGLVRPARRIATSFSCLPGGTRACFA